MHISVHSSECVCMSAFSLVFYLNPLGVANQCVLDEY